MRSEHSGCEWEKGERDMASRILSGRLRLIAATAVIVLLLCNPSSPSSSFSTSNGWPSSPCSQSCNCTRVPLGVDDCIPDPSLPSSDSIGKCVCQGNGWISDEFLDVLGLEVEFVDHVVLNNESFTNRSFSNLYCLILSGVQYIKPGGFRAVASIRKLFFRGISMTVLEKNVFMYLDQLQEIRAGDNNINALKDGCFEGLLELRNLSLVGNSIWNISRDNFRGLTALLRLDLSKNEIVRLKSRTFEFMSELRDLDISANAIVRIDRDAFHNLGNLGTLSLDGNQLQVLPEPSFLAVNGSGFQEVTVILHNNPLHCDCRMNWISTWIDKEGKHCTGTCQFPEKLKDHTLVNAYRDPMPRCRDNNSEISVDTGSMAVLTCPISFASWFVPGGVTLQDYGQSDEYYYLTNGDSLVVWNAQLQQQGPYLCVSEDRDLQLVYMYNLRVHMSKARIATFTVWGILGVIVVVHFAYAVSRRVRCHSRRPGYQNIESDNRRRDEGQQQVVGYRQRNVNLDRDDAGNPERVVANPLRNQDNPQSDDLEKATFNNLQFFNNRNDDKVAKNVDKKLFRTIRPENLEESGASNVIAK